jgi:O-antigen ligase
MIRFPSARTMRPSVSSPVAVLPALIFMGAHVPLALLMRSRPMLSTVHALITFAVGLAWAASGRNPRRVACVGAYLAGSEVLWRMTGADFFWEGAKYATVLIFLIALVRAGRLKAPPAIIAYFALLLPSTILVWMEIGFSQARSQTSFNLSGPLALAVSVWFFSHLRVSREGVSQILSALVAPIVGVFALAFFGTVTAVNLTFGRGSNLTTSGGFGPNQVSAMLGLGALAAFMLALDHSRHLVYRGAMLVLLLAFAAQSALTFSRTGVVALVICIGIGTFFLVRSQRARVSLILGLPLLAAAAVFVVVPRLDSLTGGALVDRFRNTNPTGRDQLAKADWLIFLDHPMLGVGPGQAQPLRYIAGREGVAHTEFTRMIAEHGLLGLAALILLLFSAVHRFGSARGPGERGTVAMLYTWSLLFMLVAGMRVVAPSFVFGLATAMPPRSRRAARVRPDAPSRLGRMEPAA